MCPSLPEGGELTYESIGDAYLIALDNARTPVADMPGIGAATWLGQGTGFIRGHGGGVFGRLMSDVTMTADFANAEMTVDMAFTNGNRVALSGAIEGNGFSGTEYEVVRAVTGGDHIRAEGATARFSGGFYGAGAVEAGGVYEIVGGRARQPGGRPANRRAPGATPARSVRTRRAATPARPTIEFSGLGSMEP